MSDQPLEHPEGPRLGSEGGQPEGVPAGPGPGDIEKIEGNWWYQYPGGEWIWWSRDEGRWVPVEVTRSAPTPWWLYAVIVIAVVVMIVATIAAISSIPELIEEQQQQLQEPINVLGVAGP